jgi:hypothetical protein
MQKTLKHLNLDPSDKPSWHKMDVKWIYFFLISQALEIIQYIDPDKNGTVSLSDMTNCLQKKIWATVVL